MEPVLYDLFYQQEDAHWWFQGRKRIILELLSKYAPAKSGLSVLDIGCGTGMTMQALEKFGEVAGLDKDPKAIEYCRNRGVSNLLLSDFPCGPLPRQQFDLVTMLDVVEHIEDDSLALRKAFELLRPGGVLVLTTPAFRFLWSPHDDANRHFRRYTRHQLKDRLEDAGFQIIRLSYCNFFLFVPSLVKKLMDRARYGRTPRSHLDDSVSPLMNRVYQAVFSSEGPLLARVSLPLGVSLVAIANRRS